MTEPYRDSILLLREDRKNTGTCIFLWDAVLFAGKRYAPIDFGLKKCIIY